MDINFTPTSLDREKYNHVNGVFHLSAQPRGILEIICVTYNQREELKSFINSIKSQTISNWFLRIIHDGNCHKYRTLKKELEEENYLNEQVTIECTERRYNDWGHSLRDYALKNQKKKSDWIIITNGDNYYLPTLTETILTYSAENPKTDFLYWDFIQRFDKEIHKTARTTYQPINTTLRIGRVDMGAVAIKTDIAIETGFNSRKFEADWNYIQECLKKIEFNTTKDLKKEWQVFKKITQQNEEEPPIDFLEKKESLVANKVLKIPETLFVHV